MRVNRPAALLSIGAALCMTVMAVAQNEQPEPLATTTVGIEGAVTLEHDGRRLLARPAEERSPLFVRVIEVDEPEDGSTLYEIRFMAVRPGTYDLREWLEFGVNEPATGLPPLPVRVNTLLPPDHGGDLEEMTRPAITARRWLQIALALLAIAWLLPIVVIIARRLMRRPPPTPEPEPPPPTLADQLRPLVERAIAGTITIEEQARLELLLLAYWRDRLDLRGIDQREGIARLRRHDVAGALLRQMERWLHSPDRAEMTDDEISAMLLPYSDVEAIELNESAIHTEPMPAT